MKNKGLLIIGAATVIAVGYLGYDIWTEKKEATQKQSESVLLSWNQDSIDTISIVHLQGARSIELVRSTDSRDWSLMKPVNDLTNPVSVKEFIDGLLTEKSLQKLSSVDEKSLGLDQPEGYVELDSKSLQSKIRYSISARKNFEGNAYLKKTTYSSSGSEVHEYYLAGASWLAKLQKKALDFRDRRFARQSMAAVDWVHISRGSARTELSKEGKDSLAQWVLLQKKDWIVDQNKVRETIGMLNTNQVLDFVEILPKEAKLVGTLKIKSPEWQGDFYQTLSSEGARQSYLKANGYLMLVNNSDLDRALTISMADWRDKKIPFKFFRSDVAKIKVRSNLGSLEFKRKNQDGLDWSLVSSSDSNITEDKIDQGALRGMLSQLLSLEVDQYLGLQKPSKMTDAIYSVELLKEDGNQIFKVEFANSIQKDPLTKVILGKSSLTPDYFQVSSADFADLKLDGFVKKSDTSEDGNKK